MNQSSIFSKKNTGLKEELKLEANQKSSLFQQPLAEIVSDLELESKKESVGRVISLGDGVIQASGLDNVQASELIDLGQNVYGLALNLKEHSVGIITLSDAPHLTAGDTIRRTGRILSIGVNDKILGRVVNSLGQTLDGGSELSPETYLPLEKIAPGVMARQEVDQPLQTGIKAIDSMIPIGRGQRELIIGDRSTGKSSIALATILNQADQDVICVYVAIGQKGSTLAQTQQVLEEHGALDYTTIVAATASQSAAEQFLAPYSGQAIAEYFLEQGRDVLIVFDDLSKHAVAYREISLLLRRPAGREAYPGDVFYLHSRLLERACRLNDEHGGGSITALPIIETKANDVSAYIPTNVISITDGQIYLETDLFNAGIKPAINVGLSVSRVGSAAQVKAMKQVAGTMKLDLAQYRELKAFAQFSSDLDAQTKKQLERGKRVREILKQGWDEPLKVAEQVVVIFAVVNGYLDSITVDEVKTWEEDLLVHLHSKHDSLLTTIQSELKLSEQIEQDLHRVIGQFTDFARAEKVGEEEKEEERGMSQDE